MNTDSLKIVQDVDQALHVMYGAALWLQKSGKNPSRWWQPQNMNRKFMLQHAQPDEFYAALIDGKSAAAVILQDNERNQSWKSVDKDRPKAALYVHWLCVDRQFAGKNLPRVMIDFASQQALKRNFKLLRLDTDFDEMKLRKIYEDLGFKLVAVEEEGNNNVAFYEKKVD